MVKRRLMDVTVVAIESKLEGNGTLRNVAVNDAWKRLRQSIDARSWKESESVLQELSNNLQKINMLKSMSASFAKLKQNFQNPDQMVEEPIQTPKETPRDAPTIVPKETPREHKPQTKDPNLENKALEEELTGLISTIQTLRDHMDNDEVGANQIVIPNNVSSGTKTCYQNLSYICNKCQESSRICYAERVNGSSEPKLGNYQCLPKMDLQTSAKNGDPDQKSWSGSKSRISEVRYNRVSVSRLNKHLTTMRSELNTTKKRLESSEAKHKDLEKQNGEKQEQIDKLVATVSTLEKKHHTMKEEKMGNFKDQMKQKSLERQVDLKTAELEKTKTEIKELNERLTTIISEKASSADDALNPFPSQRLAEKYTELFNKERSNAFTYYKTTMKMSETDAAKRILDILQDSFTFCVDVSTAHLEKLAADLVSPGDAVSTSQVVTKLDESELKQIQTLRKQTCKMSSEFAKNSFILLLESKNEEKYTLQEITDNMEYLVKCVEICWFFALQTPPLYINCSDLPGTKTKLDDAKYELASGKGSKVSYVTWPPLYAWRDGNILRKGFIHAE